MARRLSARARQQLYLRYPLAVFFGLGVFFAGMIPVLGLAPASLSVALLPHFLQRWWELSYSLGGLGLAVGILSRHRGIEAAGLALLGGPFMVQAWLTVEAIGAPGVPGTVFLAFVAVGCWVRFWIVVGKGAM